MAKVMATVFMLKTVKYTGTVYMCLLVILGNLKLKGNNTFCVLKTRVQVLDRMGKLLQKHNLKVGLLKVC